MTTRSDTPNSTTDSTPVDPYLANRELAHDIRNILCVISARIDMLGTILHRKPVPGLGDSAVDHQMTCLKRALQQATSLCDQACYMPTVGSVMMSDLTDMVHECCDMISPLLSANIRLTMDLQHTRPSVSCIASQLSRVLLNLMKNAIESMHESGGELRISSGQVELSEQDMGSFLCDGSRQMGEYMYVEVRDDGCGMDAQDFMRYPMLSLSKRGALHGYGLKSALDIVNASGGLMGVQSQLGKGTSVCVFFPLMPVENPPRLNDRMKGVGQGVIAQQVKQLMDHISQSIASKKVHRLS